MLTDHLLTLVRPMIGFRVNALTTPPGFNPISDELKQSTTGNTIDQCHDLLQTRTLYDTFPDKLYSFNDFLAQTRDDAIRALLDTLAGRLAEAGLSARLLGPTSLFVGTKSTAPSVVKSGRTVGFKLRCLQSDVTLTLDRIIFSGSVPENFILTLTNEETGDSREIKISQANKWQDVRFQLQAGYGYLLTYEEDSLTDGYSANNTITQWPKAKAGCQGCWAGCLGKYLAIDAIAITSNGTEITRDTNYGINLVFSAEGDVTGRLVDNPMRLLPALKQQYAMSFLEKIAYSTRKNPETEDARQGALFALTDKDNANRVPVLYDRVISSLIKSMQKEASAAIDIDQEDEVGWNSL